LGRILASLDDPLGLEQAGYALFDMYVERRGNLFASEEVYRLSKASDATTEYPRNSGGGEAADSHGRYLPPNHKFSNNDVIVLTLQPNGSGDFFTTSSLPLSDLAITAEARVLNMGPTYLDVAVSAGSFEGAFGLPPNDTSGKGNKRLRLRVDRFISDVPYQRMVAALSQLTAVPENKGPDKKKSNNEPSKSDPKESSQKKVPGIHMDDVLKEAILTTHAFTDPKSFFCGDQDVCDLERLVRASKVHV
jgi:hypothetical protein